MFKSSTFLVTILTYLFLLPEAYFQKNLLLWSIAITMLFGSFILARAMRKKMRTSYVEKAPHKTREFIILILGVVTLGSVVAVKRLNPEVGVLLIAILASCFNLGRGHINSLTAAPRIITF